MYISSYEFKKKKKCYCFIFIDISNRPSCYNKTATCKVTEIKTIIL